jgi:lysozyme family protein
MQESKKIIKNNDFSNAHFFQKLLSSLDFLNQSISCFHIKKVSFKDKDSTYFRSFWNKTSEEMPTMKTYLDHAVIDWAILH